MPSLDNAKHERFAQELAAGKSAVDAYEAAGYRRNRGHASTLRTMARHRIVASDIFIVDVHEMHVGEF